MVSPALFSWGKKAVGLACTVSLGEEGYELSRTVSLGGEGYGLACTVYLMLVVAPLSQGGVLTRLSFQPVLAFHEL